MFGRELKSITELKFAINNDIYVGGLLSFFVNVGSSLVKTFLAKTNELFHCLRLEM